MPALRTGIDLVEIERLENLKPEIRTRFCQRVFTMQELAYAGGRLERLAAMFAAKEAVAKALGCGIGPIHWKDIEIRHTDEGQPYLELAGPARNLARQLGLQSWSLSLTHTRTTAAAVVVALGGDLTDDEPE